METREKKRPTGKKRRKPGLFGVKPSRNRGASGQRTNATRRRRPPENASRRVPAQEEQRQPARDLKTDAPEMVFKPGRGEQTANDAWSATRQSSALRSTRRQIEKKRHKKRPSVVYTQPAPLQLGRIALYLGSVLAVVVAVFLGISVFFKVKTVKVYGNKAYSAWTIRESSGIEDGENLLTLGRTKASGKIIAALPYVKNARIGINLPDTVNIYIEEEDVAYSIKDDVGSWWLMTSRGRVVEQIDAGRPGNYTKVLGVELEAPAEGEQAKALESDQPVETTSGTQPDDDLLSEQETLNAPALVTAEDKLNAALEVLTALENNDIVGEAASIDVTSLVNIELWYGQRYRVKLGNLDRMDYKISCMKQAVAQMNDYQSGILDISFTTWTDQLGFTPME